MRNDAMRSWVSGFVLVLVGGSAGCGAPKPGQQAPAVSIDDDGVLFRDVSVQEGPGDLAAIAGDGVVVGLLEGAVEPVPEGTYFWAQGTSSWYGEMVAAYGSVELQILPGGMGSETAGDGASFEPQGTMWKCGNCYTNVVGGCAGFGECKVHWKY